MATIRQLPSGKWNVQIRIAGRKSTSKSFPTKAEANAWATEQECSFREEIKRIPSWKDIGLRYCIEVLRGRPSQSIAMDRVERISRYESMNKPFTDITIQDVNAYKIHRLEQVSPTTCRDELVMIKRVYRWMDKETRAQGLDPIPNPCEHVTIPKANKTRNRVVTPEELTRLLDALPSPMRPIVELAYETAMRRSEILKLRVRDFHPDERLASVVDGKTGDRSVPLTTRAVEILQEGVRRLGEHRVGSTRLFTVAPHSVTTAVRRARRKAGLDEDVRLHQLRHTRCTIVARKGFNPAQIMAVTGHKDIRSVQRYTHLNAADVIKLLD